MWPACRRAPPACVIRQALLGGRSVLMSGADDDHERTMAFAEIAFGQIKALRQAASPRHFEIWYTYATGYNPSLNQKINEVLTRNGTLSDADVNDIYEEHISSNRFTDRIDDVGVQVMGE